VIPNRSLVLPAVPLSGPRVLAACVPPYRPPEPTSGPPTKPVTVRREVFRLRTPDGYGLPTVTWGAATPLVVAAGQTQTSELRDRTHESLDRAKPMTLDPHDGVQIGGVPVTIGEITFTPRKRT